MAKLKWEDLTKMSPTERRTIAKALGIKIPDKEEREKAAHRGAPKAKAKAKPKKAMSDVEIVRRMGSDRSISDSERKRMLRPMWDRPPKEGAGWKGSSKDVSFSQSMKERRAEKLARSKAKKSKKGKP